MKLDLYLDIDGVLLKKNGEVPHGLEDFLRFAISNFNCFWLTTHCKGNSSTPIRYLSKYFSPNQIELLQNLQATNWDSLKTDAIDFSRPFVWLDDQPFESEKLVLNSNGCSNQLIIVDLDRHRELKQVAIQLLPIIPST